jgi:hypothetical protein
LEFEIQHRYEESALGILVPVRLLHGGRSVDMKARLDTGASDCLFDRSYAEVLDIEVETGFRRTCRTGVGSFVAFGHEVSVRTLGMECSAVVFFHESRNPANAFVGRRGWLDRIRLGLVHYDRDLYLAEYGS